MFRKIFISTFLLIYNSFGFAAPFLENDNVYQKNSDLKSLNQIIDSLNSMNLEKQNKLSMAEKNIYTMIILDKINKSVTGQSKRYYLPKPEIRLSVEELKIRYLNISNQLNKIIDLIKKNHPDREKYYSLIESFSLKRGFPAPYDIDPYDSRRYSRKYFSALKLLNPNIKFWVNPIGIANKFNSRYHKHIIEYLYYFPFLQRAQSQVCDQDNSSKKESCLKNRYMDYFEHYLADFEYSIDDSLAFRQKREIELEYEALYLYIKASGLLRYATYAFYPKSFLREYANQTGLTKFIMNEQRKAGKQLKHDELAEQFFGSYDKWMTGFEQFLQQKIITLKI